MANGSEAAGSRSELVDGRPLERRQLTIMFTDLVDSTGLADSMDPEDFRALIEAHRTIAVAPILRYGGVVARYLGDGMLVLFGYPEAHEDDPERAVRAGLEVASATEAMNSRWVGEGRGRIAVRIGVHTGIVVVGDVLKADVQEIMAVFGNAPSIASRLQALAKPNSVVLSGATKELLPPAILCETRGNTTLRGVRRPVEIFSALEVREGQGDRRAGRRVLPFVNREKELSIIRRCWASARRGEGRCLVIEGDPGIGKSRLIRAVEERIVTQPSRWLISRTSPYATNTDFFTFSELFRHVLTAGERTETRSGTTFTRLKHILKGQGVADPEIALGLAGLLGIDIPKKAIATPLQPERARELTLRAITGWLQHESSRQPLVLVIEDLHWADASTLEAIERLKQNLTNHPLFLIGTTRGATRTSLTGGAVDSAAGRFGTHAQPGDAGTQPTTPALETVARSAAPAQGSLAGAASTTVRLKRLGAAYAEDLLGHVLQGVELPKASVTTLLERANGVPLYLEELPKPVLEAGSGGGVSVTLPATLRDSLMAQLDGMGEAKAVAQTAAVLGHSFERPILEKVWEGRSESLDAGLNVLADAELIRPEDKAEATTYGFRHALLAEIAYDSLLRDERRRIHRKTADIIVKHFRLLSEIRPELTARHHQAARNYDAAFECWLEAGRAAAGRSANVEAMEHFQNAEFALSLTDGSASHAGFDQRRFDLCSSKTPVLVALQGWGAKDVEETLRSTLKLAETTDATPRERFDGWGGLSNVYLLRGQLDAASEALNHMNKIAEKENDNELILSWHRIQGLCSLLSAEFTEAKLHEEKALALEKLSSQTRHTATTGTNPLVIAHSIKAWSHYFVGETDAAIHHIDKALDVAKRAQHPFSQCYALCLASSLAQFREKPEDALTLGQRAAELASQHRFAYWQAWATMMKGWALSSLGKSNIGLPLLTEGHIRYCETGAAQMVGYGFCLLADASLRSDRINETFDYLTQAISEMKRTGIVFYESEAYRILGEAMKRSGRSRQATLSCLRAANLAKRQKALSSQYRGLLSLLMVSHLSSLSGTVWNEAHSLLKRIAPNTSSEEVEAMKEKVREAAEHNQCEIDHTFGSN